VTGSAALFPGQGAQYIGMGQSLHERFAQIRGVFRRASELLGWDLWELCMEGPEEELRETDRAQPAIFTLSYAMYGLLRDLGWEPEMMAGHSVGELAALTAAGGLPFEDGLRAVAIRGKLMAQASRAQPGTMLALLGAATEAVEGRIRSLKRLGVIEIANYNCPGQVVISLERRLLEQAKQVFSSLAKRVVELPVSGAFHSPLMAEAQKGFAEFLSREDLRFREPRVPILLSATLALSRDPLEIREALIAQITSPIRWEQMMAQMIRSGVRTFIEVGPKDVLTRLVKRSDRDCQALATDGRDPREIIKALRLGVG